MELQLTGNSFLPLLLGPPGNADALVPKAEGITKKKKISCCGASVPFRFVLIISSAQAFGLPLSKLPGNPEELRLLHPVSAPGAHWE